MKKAVLCILVLLLVPNCVKLNQAIADETKRSGIAWYLNLQGYNLPHVLEKGMYALYMPRTLDCGEVQVTLQEVLYDGYWIFTAASVTPTSSKKTLVMPGSAGVDESVSGGNGEKSRLDSRTFREAATEDGKRLLSVYVYPKEFDYLPFYFLDHRQDENDSSTLFSGSRLPAPSDTLTMHWSISVYEVDTNTGIYTVIDEHEYPAVITPLGNISAKTYTLTGEKAMPFESITLLQTALTTYAIPSWVNEADQGVYAFSLLDENHHQIEQGLMPDAYTFTIEQLPDELFVQVLNTQSREQYNIVCFLSELE